MYKKFQFLFNFDPNLPLEDGQNQKNQIGYTNK